MQSAEILARLVGFPSVLGQANDEIVGFVQDYLKRFGVEAHVLPGPEGDRSNLFATIGPDAPGGLVLSGHLDVVPAADQPGWLADPFVLREESGRLIGRGAVDMKGFVAAVLSQVPNILAMDLKRPVHIALSYDEEAGCRGVPHLIKALPNLCVGPLHCVIGEPTGLAPVLQHKGKATLRVRAKGVPGHSARPAEGKNAIHAVLPVLQAAVELSETLASGHQNPDFEPPFSTAQIGTLAGGTAINVIPDRAEAMIELRALPDADPVKLLDPVIELAQAAGIDTQIVAHYPGLGVSGSAPLADAVREIAGRAPVKAVSFGTEAGLFAKAGHAAIVCGPGDIARAHKPEEYITLEELNEAERMIRDLAQVGP